MKKTLSRFNEIFARKITVLHKNGFRTDYTHVTEFKIHNPIPRMNSDIEPSLLIKGETDDVAGDRCNVVDKLPIKDLQMTIIDWYIPPE